MKYLRYILPIICILALSPVAAFAKTDALGAGAQPVSAVLLSEQSGVAPGEPFWVGVELKMEQGWDTYWQNPGDAGFPTQIEWKLPSGFKAGPIQWPAPKKFTTENMVGFGYTDSVLLMAEITPPKNLSAKDIPIQADVSWLACKESCEPGNAHLELVLPVVDKSATDAKTAAVFAKAKSALPKTADITVASQADSIILKVNTPSSGISAVQFFPEQSEVIDYLAPQTAQVSKGGVEINLKKSPVGAAMPHHVKGVLTFSDETGNQHVLQVDSKIKQAATTAMTELSGFWVALALAFVGGLILNVMPCVMPVIALKIFSFVKMAQEKRSEILKQGLFFTAGVLVSFWVLSGALLLLRFSGQSLGWGFQLQEPVFVAVLAGILFLLGLSLFGVFELGTSLISVGQQSTRSKSPVVSSFMSGVLATLVATPCTGPLLGPALGFAMAVPAIQSLLIFTGMGLGMASPYLFFSAFPKLIRFMPKPGNWMVIFKQLMGFLMMATVTWLIWVFGAQTGNMAVFMLLVALLVMGVGAWIYGQWGSPMKPRRTRLMATIAALLIIAVGGTQSVMAAKKFQEESVAPVASNNWEAFSPERVAQLQAEGKPVFVDFTAKWCLICQANKVVLHSSDAARLFKEYGVVPMVADWTKKDPVITQELASMGRSGVPVYALYPPEKDAKPYLLPQTLSGNILSEYLTKIDANG